jgi:hypothetical protein
MYLMVVSETIEVFIFGITVEQFSKIWSDSGIYVWQWLIVIWWFDIGVNCVVVIRVDLCFLKTIEYAGLLNTFLGFHYPCCNFGKRCTAESTSCCEGFLTTWHPVFLLGQGFQSGPVPGTFTRLRSCIVPVEITEPPKN